MSQTDLIERLPDAQPWEYTRKRIEWRVQSVEVDQYDQNPVAYATAVFPTQELAAAHRERIAKPHEWVEGRWAPNDAPHSYVDCYVTRAEVPVDDAELASLRAELEQLRREAVEAMKPLVREGQDFYAPGYRDSTPISVSLGALRNARAFVEKHQ